MTDTPDADSPDMNAVRDARLQEDDVVRVLLDQHQRILDLFSGVRSASGDARMNSLRELRALLVVHETAEQLVVHPETARLVSPEFTDRLTDAEKDLTTHIGRLEQIPPEHGQFEENLDAIERAVVDHFFVEESEELPVLYAQCPVDARVQLGRRLMATEKIVPTRAHPAIDSVGPAAAVLSAPLTAIVDRVRDVLAQEG